MKAVIVTLDGINISVQISGFYHDRLIKDNQIKLLTANEKYLWLGNKIILGKGKVTAEGLEVDYFYEPLEFSKQTRSLADKVSGS